MLGELHDKHTNVDSFSRVLMFLHNYIAVKVYTYIYIYIRTDVCLFFLRSLYTYVYMNLQICWFLCFTFTYFYVFICLCIYLFTFFPVFWLIPNMSAYSFTIHLFQTAHVQHVFENPKEYSSELFRPPVAR